MKGPLAAVLALAVLAAGCVSTSDLAPAGTTDLDAPLDAASVVHRASGAAAALPVGAVAAAGGQYWTGVAASEPTIATTSDGALYMTGNVPNPTCALAGGCPAIPYAGFSKGPTIMRSLDRGLTWEDVYPKLPTGDSEKLRTWDPYVLVDPATDRIFMDDIYPIGCGSLAYSDDGGASWTRDPASCGNPQVNDHQTLVAAKPRTLPTALYPNLVYRCVNNLLYVGCAISINGGLTFLPQVPIEETMGECSAITGHLEADLEGRVYLGLPCGGAPGVLMTEDDGLTWRLAMVSQQDLDGHDVDLATDEAGNVYALFLSGGMPWFAVSTDHGDTWAEPIMVAPPSVTATKFNAIAAGAPGKVAFAYVGTTLPGGYDNPQAECGVLPALPCTEPDAWANATWNAYVGVIEDALVADPVIRTVTANDPADPLARGACADRCHGMTDFIDVTIDIEGRPWASFVDVCVAECITDASVLYDGNLGFAGTLVRGPALRGVGDALPELLPATRPAVE